MLSLCYLVVVFGSSWQKGSSNYGSNKYGNDYLSNSDKYSSSGSKNFTKKYDSICDVNVLDEASEIYKMGALSNKYGSSNTKEKSSFSAYKEPSTSSEPSWKRYDDSGKLAAINPWSMHTNGFSASKLPSATSKDKYSSGSSDKSKYSLMKEHSYARKK